MNTTTLSIDTSEVKMRTGVFSPTVAALDFAISADQLARAVCSLARIARTDKHPGQALDQIFAVAEAASMAAGNAVLRMQEVADLVYIEGATSATSAEGGKHA